MVLHNDAETRAAVVQLLAAFRVPPGQYEMGRTKVFFKPGALLLLVLLVVQRRGGMPGWAE
jgi:myosin heavy subunit